MARKALGVNPAGAAAGADLGGSSKDSDDTHLLRSVIKLCKLGRLDKPGRTRLN